MNNNHNKPEDDQDSKQDEKESVAQVINKEHTQNGSSQSYLSNAKYGYDFVVATTQASINSCLKEYLSKVSQPVACLCFLVDKDGVPNQIKTLAEVIELSGGIDPFSIPPETRYDDPRIAALTKIRFSVGLKYQLGLPTNVLPKDLPNIFELGPGSQTAATTFNLFFKQFVAVENIPPTWGPTGVWNVFSQSSASGVWYFSTRLRLVSVCEPVDTSLNTPYFNNIFPKKKIAIKNSLAESGLSSDAFSLQQLLFDLNEAEVMSLPTIKDAGKNLKYIFTNTFTNYYFKQMKIAGEPLLSINVKLGNEQPDRSTLCPRHVEFEGSPGDDGNPDAQTLDYLCTVSASSKKLQPVQFSWSWVDVDQLADIDGVVAINRNTFAKYLIQTLTPVVSQYCVKPTVSVEAHMMGSCNLKYSLEPGQIPTSTISPISDKDKVFSLSYACSPNASDKSGATYGGFDIHTTYNCDVQFSGTAITITQNATAHLKIVFDSTSAHGLVVNKTVTDTYDLSVEQNGSLGMTLNAEQSKSTDDGKNIDIGGLIKYFVNLNPAINNVTKTCRKVSTLQTIQNVTLNNFVFPGGNVFTFKRPTFSNYQDLVAAITYVAPRE